MGDAPIFDLAKMNRKQRRKSGAVAKALPASALAATTLRDRVLVGIEQPGYVSLTWAETNQLIKSLEKLADSIEPSFIADLPPD